MLLKILKSPVTLAVSVLAGILIGVFCSWLAPALSIFNQMYTSALQMGIIPVIACALIVNAGYLLKAKNRHILVKWLATTVGVMLLASALGVGVLVASHDSIKPDERAKTELLKVSSEVTNEDVANSFKELRFFGKNDANEANKFTLTKFILSSVPSNIFKSLTQNNIVQILIFSCIFGSVIRLIDEKRSQIFISLATGLYKSFCKFVEYLLIPLPVAIGSLLAEEVANLGKSEYLNVGLLAKFIGTVYVVALIIILISFFVVQACTKCSLRAHFKSIKEIFFISMATSSCVAATPTLIEKIPTRLGLNKRAASTMAPVGALLCQPGTIAVMALFAAYATTVYDVPLDSKNVALILISAIVFTFSTIGLSSLTLVSMFSVVLQPLGVPSDLMSLVFLSSVLFFQGIVIFASAYSNIAIMAFVLSPKAKNEHELFPEVELAEYL